MSCVVYGKGIDSVGERLLPASLASFAFAGMTRLGRGDRVDGGRAIPHAVYESFPRKRESRHPAEIPAGPVDPSSR
jgi:hypothetical protein